MIGKILSYLLVAFFIFGSCALAQSIDYQKLLDYLDSKFPASYQVVSQVAEKYQDRLTLPIKEKPLSRGQELVVLSQKKGVPVYLLPQAAVIRVESSFQEKVLAQEVKVLPPQNLTPNHHEPLTGSSVNVATAAFKRSLLTFSPDFLSVNQLSRMDVCKRKTRTSAGCRLSTSSTR